MTKQPDKYRTIRKIVTILAVFCWPAALPAQQIYLNELLAVNGSVNQNLAGENNDWIEIFNPGTTAVDLSGMYLTDDRENPTRWRFPDSSKLTLIQPKGYLLIWADEGASAAELHAGFKLSGDGEFLALVDRDGATILDSLTFPQQYLNVSFGRSPNAGPNWYYFDPPSPAAANSSSGYSGRSAGVFLNKNSGFYSSPVHINITAPEPGTIYYTLDGSEPGPASIPYQDPLIINQTSVLRARLIGENKLPGPVLSATFLIDEPLSLPVVSLITAPGNLFGSKGIYSQKIEGQERPVHVQFFDSRRQLQLSQQAGVRMHSPDTKPQLSMRLYAREQYGAGEFAARFFQNSDVDVFKVLVLRNGGNDNMYDPDGTMLRDPLVHLLFWQRNQNYDLSACQPVNVFINGDYWGIYNLRERQDRDYLASHHAIGGPVDFLERAFNYEGNRTAIEGDWNEYDRMRAFMEESDLSQPGNYSKARQMIDVDNFSDYWITEIFTGNYDWLINNQKFWRERSPQGIWRWVLWDVDHGLGLPYTDYGINFGSPGWNTLDWATGTTGPRVWSGNSTIIIRNLLENESYRTDFINRFCDLLNTLFQPEHTIHQLDSLAAILEPDMPAHTARWNRQLSQWYSAVNVVKNYLRQRPSAVLRHLQKKFDLADSSRITINTAGGANPVELNTIRLRQFPWQGIYFNGLPVRLIARPQRYYTFSHWQVGRRSIGGDTLLFVPERDTTITAVYEEQSITRLVINEINFKPSEEMDTGDWVEIYNAGTVDVDLQGWYFQDEDDEHRFYPGQLILPRGEFIVFCQDRDDFIKFFPDVAPAVGDLGFGLDRNSEKLRLYNALGQLADFVEYESGSPWPAGASGTGYTLELIDADSDNNKAQSWSLSATIGGSPGRANTVTDLEAKPGLPKQFALQQNFPNPFNPVTTIRYQLPQAAEVELRVFNLLGQQVARLVRDRQPAGYYSLRWQADNLASGVYILQFAAASPAGPFVRTQKMILLR